MPESGEALTPLQRAELHPRPQLTRARWTDLSGPWGFAYDDADAGLAQGWVTHAESFDRTIVVPFPPESPASGIADPDFHPIVWYRRAFHLGEGDGSVALAADERLLLHFGAVDYRAQVWVNGRLIASHEGGMTPFSADITAALDRAAPEQVIVVRAEDAPFDLTQPRGKQYWELESRGIWHPRTTGIWQPVWLEPVGAAHIAGLRWTPDPQRGLLGLRVTLNRAPAAPLRLGVRLTLHGAVLADDEYAVAGAEVAREIVIATGNLSTTMDRQRLLWAPEHPNLIEAELRLLDDGRALDAVQSYAGLRSAGVANGRFQLNGRPYYLRLVLEQGYWPESHLAAPGAGALRREVELIKELGFNGARIHQKVEDPRFLFWCDRLGLVIWGEMANAFVFAPGAVERLTREWLDVVRRDYSHPCIVTWVPLNESWGVPALARDLPQQHYLRALYHLTHALDATRPVIGNDGWEHLASDIWGLHDYAREGAPLRERYGSPEAIERTIRGDNVPPPHAFQLALPGARRDAGEPIMLTEFGGTSYAPRPGERWFGYGMVTSSDAYLAKYAELVGAILACPTVVGFCYTQLTDTVQETNGLLTEGREHKLDPAAIRAITEARTEAAALAVVDDYRARAAE